MGQYYRGVILKDNIDVTNITSDDIHEAFCCYEHDNGAKLMEHSYVNNWYVKEYENKLANECFGNRFVWVGDYADSDLFSLAHDFIETKTINIAEEQGYYIVANHFENDYGDIKEYDDFKSVTDYDVLVSTTYEYIINFTKKMFIRIPKRGECLTIHPLPLLCADGNGRGGGDYYGSNMELIGSWAYDKIGVANEIPDDITDELVVTFQEYCDNGNDYQIVKRTI